MFLYTNVIRKKRKYADDSLQLAVDRNFDNPGIYPVCFSDVYALTGKWVLPLS